MKTIYSDCDPSVREERTLPTNAFIVEYLQDTITKFDVVMSSKQVDIFDHYWDNYRSDLKNITQCEGRINPRLYNIPKK
tara:strand:+ start:3937 stop:4173 length:237 start_codon:yes stop_codon:yes gene_type:complete